VTAIARRESRCDVDPGLLAVAEPCCLAFHVQRASARTAAPRLGGPKPGHSQRASAAHALHIHCLLDENEHIRLTRFHAGSRVRRGQRFPGGTMSPTKIDRRRAALGLLVLLAMVPLVGCAGQRHVRFR
jgi:hypothetical protein